MAESIDRGVTRKFWEQRADLADDPRSVTLTKFGGALARREVGWYQGWLFGELARLGKTAGAALDLGCGNGDWTLALAARGWSVTAVDGSAGFVAHIERRAAAEGRGAEVRARQVDLEQYALPPGNDLVVMGAVSQYLNDDALTSVLARIKPALAAGGVFYFRTTVARKQRWARQGDGYHAIYRERAWYDAALSAAGFQTIAAGDHDTIVSRQVSAALATPIRAALRLYRATQPNTTRAWLLHP